MAAAGARRRDAVLFSDASRIELRADAVPARLLGAALPVTIAGGTLAAVVVLPQLSLAEAVVLASDDGPAGVRRLWAGVGVEHALT
jgi:hypothetical protein